jgi:hypothetical protein
VGGKLGIPLSWNRYLYCRLEKAIFQGKCWNDPINYFDPDGRFFYRIFTKISAWFKQNDPEEPKVNDTTNQDDERLIGIIDVLKYKRADTAAAGVSTGANPDNLDGEELCYHLITDVGLTVGFATVGFFDDAWRAVSPSRPLSKMGHAKKHLKDFKKINPNLDTNDVAKILEYVKMIGKPMLGQHGGKEYTATILISGKSVTVKVIESAAGVIKTGYPI